MTYPFDGYDGTDASFEKLQDQAPLVCGDCGGNLRTERDVVGWTENGEPASWDVRNVHTDDDSPQCMGRRDAARRKPGYFACMECGQPPNERHLKSCMNPTGEAGGLVVKVSADPSVRWGKEFETVSCRNCQAEIHPAREGNMDDGWNDWGLSEVCAGTSTPHTPQWSTAQLQRDFEVVGFAMYMCVARRRYDGKLGSLDFDHRPRFYFDWKEDTQ